MASNETLSLSVGNGGPAARHRCDCQRSALVQLAYPIMRISTAWTLLALAWTASAQSLNATTNSSFPVISIDDDPRGALNITAWALIYTYPFAIFANVVGGILRGNGTVNALVNQRFLASPGETGVIKRASR